MNDYISREDYCEENCGKENREGYKTCKNCGMLNIPTADVQPIRHGRWICNEELYYNGMTKCSCCNEEYYTEDIQNLQGDLRTVNYCPNCGARMDGEQND